eukprot:424343-Hanusia_phi.AAC.3
MADALLLQQHGPVSAHSLRHRHPLVHGQLLMHVLRHGKVHSDPHRRILLEWLSGGGADGRWHRSDRTGYGSIGPPAVHTSARRVGKKRAPGGRAVLHAGQDPIAKSDCQESVAGYRNHTEEGEKN